MIGLFCLCTSNVNEQIPNFHEQIDITKIQKDYVMQKYEKK